MEKPKWPAGKPLPKWSTIDEEEAFYAAYALDELFDQGKDVEPAPDASSNLSDLKRDRG